MIAELLKYINQVTVGTRAPLLEAKDGSRRLWIYSDQERDYQELPEWLQRERDVSNIESFAAMVQEEARRAALAVPLPEITTDETDTHLDQVRADLARGNWMTVVFSQNGGRFFLNDRDPRTVFSYTRTLAPQFALLMNKTGQALSHTDFIRLLQSLRPSLVDFAAVTAAFRKLSFSRSVKMESAPQLIEGATGTSYALTLKVDGHDTKTTIPDRIKFKVPFARGSTKTYEVDAEVMCELDENDGKPQPVFGLIIPDISATVEQAIAEEVAWFRDQTKDLTLLSILEDY